MKRGCLTRVVFLAIIAAAVIVYIVDKYGSGIYESSKEKIRHVVVEKLQEQLSDSLATDVKNSFNTKLDELKSIDIKNEKEKFDAVIQDLKLFINEQSDKSDKFEELKKILDEYEK